MSLSYIAEKVSPKVSGILSGLPVGSSITLVFFAIENGVDYVTKVALYNIHGLFAALAFSIGYYISTFYKGKFEIFLSLLISFISYLIIAFILNKIKKIKYFLKYVYNICTALFGRVYRKFYLN